MYFMYSMYLRVPPPTHLWWGGQMGMARSAVRSRSLSLRHTKISLTLTKSVMLDLTVIHMGDRLLAQKIPNPFLVHPPALRSKHQLQFVFREFHVLVFADATPAALRAGGFRVATNFGLRILVVDRSIAAPTGLSNVVQMFETAQVQCARHNLEAGRGARGSE